MVLHLDLDNPLHVEVVKLIKDAGIASQQREFMLSAILYYARSPSYLTILKFEELLTVMKNNNFGILSPPIEVPSWQGYPEKNYTGSPVLKIEGSDGCSGVFEKMAQDAF